MTGNRDRPDRCTSTPTACFGLKYVCRKAFLLLPKAHGFDAADRLIIGCDFGKFTGGSRVSSTADSAEISRSPVSL
jgi:hypothetical protein